MARRMTMAASTLEEMLAHELKAMDQAGRHLAELADIGKAIGAGPRVAELTAAIGATLTETRALLQQIARQWEGFQTRYHMGERIIQAQEEERRHVAREIHDGPAQSMANVVLRAEICERLLAAGRPQVTQELAQLKLIVKESLREVRKIIFDLRPMALDDLGLVPTLYRYMENLKEQYDIDVELAVSGDERRLSSTLEVALFRMIQESINNARKHAQASRIVVHLSFGADSIEASVHDDGVGFDVAEVEKEWLSRQSFGLMGMRERIELLDGEFSVQSSQRGGGTTVTARLPYVEQPH